MKMANILAYNELKKMSIIIYNQQCMLMAQDNLQNFIGRFRFINQLYKNGNLLFNLDQKNHKINFRPNNRPKLKVELDYIDLKSMQYNLNSDSASPPLSNDLILNKFQVVFLSIMSKLCRRNVPHDDIKTPPLPLPTC